MCIFVPKIGKTRCTPDESLFNRQALCRPNRMFYWPFQMSLKEKEFHLPLDELTVTISKMQEKTLMEIPQEFIPRCGMEGV